MPWNARLQIDYTLHQGKTRAHHQHVGPLRILQSLYPEGDRVCHNVLVHPPGGLVGGDTLDLEVNVGPQAHGLLTTPGATRFYRSAAEPARQNTYLRLAAGARLEWLRLQHRLRLFPGWTGRPSRISWYSASCSSESPAGWGVVRNEALTVGMGLVGNDCQNHN